MAVVYHVEMVVSQQVVARVHRVPPVAFAWLSNVSLPVLRTVYAHKVFSVKKGCSVRRLSLARPIRIARVVFVIVKGFANKRLLNLV